MGDCALAEPKRRTCPNCGKQFTPWRTQRFCSEQCRKAAENRRLRGSKPPREGNDTPDPLTTAPTGLDHAPVAVSTVVAADLGEEVPDRPLLWVACNEVTHKCSRREG